MADLFGKYQLLDRIAAGAVAEVFQAKSHGVEGFEKVVVIKRIRREHSANAAFIEGFIEAAKKAVTLSHANVVQVFDLGQHEGCYFIAMEHVAGPDLGRVLQTLDARGQSMPVELALHVTAEVAKGLDHAHRRRDYAYQPLEVVHGGLTPANVLSSSEGEIKLIDFGFTAAQRHLAGDNPGLLADKVPYLAPELVSGSEAPNAAADVYGVGALLHHMLHGEPPDSESKTAELETRFPEGLMRILDRCLSADPAARFASAGELFEDLISTLFVEGWKPSSRTWADFLGAMLGPSVEVTGSEHELSLDDVLLLDDDAVEGDEIEALFHSRSHANLRVVPAPEEDEGVPTRAQVRRADTALERPSARRASAARAIARDTVVVAVVTGSGDDPPGLDEDATRWGGRVQRIDGLPTLVIFGAGTLPARAMERGLRFALSISRKVARRSSVGVHFASVGGREEEADFSPDHDDAGIIRAADLAKTGMPGDVLVSEAGPRLLPDVFAFSPPFEMSGGHVAHRVGESQAGTALTGGHVGPSTRRIDASQVDDEAPRTRRAVSFVPPGREDDLASIIRIVERVREGEARVFLLEAPRGAGKTAVLEAARRACARVEMAWFMVRCDPWAQRVPFQGVRTLIAEVCGIEEDDSADTLAERLQRLAELGIGADDIRAVKATFGLVPAGAVNRDWIGLFTSVLRRIARGLGEDRPTALVVEDAEHLDHQSRRVLRELAERLPGARALLWLSALPGDLAELDRHEHVVRRRLSPLNDQALRFLARRVAARAGVSEADEELVDLVLDASGGDPRYVEHGTRLLAELDQLEGTDGGLPLLPETLEGVIAARLALLPEEERGVLQRAAAIGPVFGLSLLTRVLREPAERVRETIDRAMARGILEPFGPGRRGFRSGAVQQSLYHGIEPYARREVHARIALELEALHADDRERFIEVLGRHTALSGDIARAVTYLEDVAERFLAERAPAAALPPLQDAAALLESDPDADVDQRIDVLIRVGQVATGALRFDDARGALEAALRLARVARRERRVARCLLASGRVSLAEGRFSEASGLLGRALQLSDGLRDRRLVGEIYGALGETWEKNGDLVRALDFLGKAVRVAEDEGDHSRLAALLPLLANAASGAGDFQAAERWLERGLRMAEKSGDRLLRVRVLKAYSLLDYYRAAFEPALRRCLEALEIARSLGDTEDVVVLLHNAGDMCIQLGEHERAYRYLVGSTELCRAHGISRTELTNEIYLVWLEALRQGDPPPAAAAKEAEGLLRAAWARAEDLGLTWEALQARWFVAQCLAAQGESTDAAPLFRDVLEGARSIHLMFMVRHAEEALKRLAG